MNHGPEENDGKRKGKRKRKMRTYRMRKLEDQKDQTRSKKVDRNQQPQHSCRAQVTQNMI